MVFFNAKRLYYKTELSLIFRLLAQVRMRKSAEHMNFTAGMTDSGHPLLKMPRSISPAIRLRTSAKANELLFAVGCSRFGGLSS